MSTLTEIELASEALSPDQKKQLVSFLIARLHSSTPPLRKARVVRDGDDVLLEAPSDAPPMTAENVKRMIEDWP